MEVDVQGLKDEDFLSLITYPKDGPIMIEEAVKIAEVVYTKK